MAVQAKPGFFRNCRAVKRRSCKMVSKRGSTGSWILFKVHCSRISGCCRGELRFLGQILQLECFGFQNLERLTPFVRFLAAAFGGFLVLLRNKATLGAGTLVAALAHFGCVAGKGAIVRDLITHVERERLMGRSLLFGRAGYQRLEAIVLQTNAAAREPEG